MIGYARPEHFARYQILFVRRILYNFFPITTIEPFCHRLRELMLCKNNWWLWDRDEGTIKTSIPKCRIYWCFCLGWWCSNFVGSESGQKQSVKLLQNMVYNTTQHPLTQQPHIVCIYCTFALGRVRGVGEVREKVEGQQFTRGVEITTWLTVSPVYKLYLTPVKTTFRVLCLYSSIAHG